MDRCCRDVLSHALVLTLPVQSSSTGVRPKLASQFPISCSHASIGSKGQRWSIPAYPVSPSITALQKAAAVPQRQWGLQQDTKIILRTGTLLSFSLFRTCLVRCSAFRLCIISISTLDTVVLNKSGLTSSSSSAAFI